MIWSKTDAGRAECQTRALIKERAQRNLLLLIDGVKTEAALLVSVAGTRAEDFTAMQTLHLISAMAGSSSKAAAQGVAAQSPAAQPVSPVPAPSSGVFLDYSQFTAELTHLISRELGLRGFTLTLAVEKASSIEELRDVANRVIEQIHERKGKPAAEKAYRSLYGG